MKNTTQIMRRCHALALAGLIGAGAIVPAGTSLAVGPGETQCHGHISRRTGAELRRQHRDCFRNRKHLRTVCFHCKSQCVEEGKRRIPDAGRLSYQ